MVLIALGANLPGPNGSPRQTLESALDALDQDGVRVLARSLWYVTAPVPASDQPDFVNAVVRVSTVLSPPALLTRLHGIEARFGRERLVVNGARTLDLDLLDYNGHILDDPALVLPHPRMETRAFVLVPLRDVAPHWRHPVTGVALSDLILDLGDLSGVRVLAG